MTKRFTLLAALPLLLGAAQRSGTVSPTSDVSSNQVTATGSTTARKLKDRFAEVINAKDYGAKCDGVTNDTAAIDAAVAAAKLNAGTMVLPAGTCLTDGITLAVNGASGVHFRGASTTKTRLKGTASALFVLGITGSGGGYNQFNTVEDLTIDMSAMSDLSSRIGIYLTKTWGNSFRNVNVYAPGSSQRAMRIEDGTYATVFDNCDFGSTTGKIDISGVTDYPTTLDFRGSSFGALVADKANFLSFDRSIVQGALDKFTLSNVIGVNITACDIEGTGVYLALGTAVSQLRSIGNGMAGFSGTYQTGTFTTGLLADNGFRVVGSVSADRGDTSQTLTVGTDAQVQRWATTLTANRTVTCSTTGAANGDSFRVVRTGLGAFTLDVCGLKTIAGATAAFVDVSYSGSAWVLTGYGPL